MPPSDDALPYLGPLRLDRQKIKKAKQDLEEPSLRIRSEIFWLSTDFIYFTECQRCLRAGHYTEFITYCENAISKELVFPPDVPVPKENLSLSLPDEKALREEAGLRVRIAVSLARHHLAVFYHSSAIAIGRRSARPIPGANLPPANWDRAFQYWLAVQEDDLFWQYLASRARMLGDARLKPEHLDTLRKELLRELLNVNVALALESLERGEQVELISQVKVINSSPFGQQLRTQACEALVAPLHSQFEKACKDIQPKLADKAILALASTLEKAPSGEGFVGTLDQEKLRPYLVEIERSINKRILPIANRVREANLHNMGTGIEILDGAAYLLRAMCLALNNHAGLPSEALRVANVAQRYAASRECRERLLEDQRTLNYLALQQEAIELAKANRIRDSIAKLDQALQFASTNEERRTVEQWKEQAERLIAYEAVEPIDRAPSLYTVRGIGTTLYGRRDFDSATKSYVATLYFTFFFIPIFPIAAYRVIDQGGGAYRFLGKVPLSRAAFVAPGILAALFLFAVISSNLNTSTPRPRGTPTVVPASGNQPVPDTGADNQAPRRTTPNFSFNNERESLRVWLQRERARISTERAELDQLDALLSIEGNKLKEQRADLERRQNQARLYGYGGPSDYEIDSYNAALRDFNRRAAALDARQARLQADIEEFNRKISLYNSMR